MTLLSTDSSQGTAQAVTQAPNQNTYLPTPLQQYIHLSRYARWLDKEGRRENWPETVNRYVSFFDQKYPGVFPTDQLRDSILHLKTMPSMRALMTAGKALDRDNVAGFNCSFLAIDHPRAFDEALYILMCGTGLGFSVERQFIAELPAVAEALYPSDTTIVVSDSKIGWATAYRELISMLYAGKIPKWDVSKVRPAGAKLKTFGGRASGPKPLEDLFRFTIETFRKAAGRKLTSVECHDIVCKVADIVVVGGVRRSALISLSNLSDDRMRIAKSGQWWETNPQRALANNSAVYNERPEMEVFLKEWTALIESKSGERGIFSRRSAKLQAEKTGRRDAEHEFGTNPCFRGDTLIHTRQGAFQIQDLVGKTVDIWDGNQYVTIDNFRVTGENQEVFSLTLQDGSEIVATAYHTFIKEDGSRIQLRDLSIGDRLLISNAPIHEGGQTVAGAYIKGFMLGDGTMGASGPVLWVYGPKEGCTDRLIASAAELPTEEVKATNLVTELGFMEAQTYGRRRMRGLAPRRAALEPWATSYKYALPKEIFAWSVASKSDFLAGLLDSDGTAMDGKNGFGYQLTSVNRDFLLDVQALLKTLNVQSKLSLSKPSAEKVFPDGKAYETQALYRLSVSQSNSIKLAQLCKFSRLQSFADREISNSMKPRFSQIVAIESAGVESEVYCCTVPTNHQVALGASIITGQCGEILLRSCGFCNLTEVVIRADDSFETLKQKVENAVIMGTFQSTLTDFRYLRPIWKRNAEEERLLGVSMTGIMDHPVLSKVSPLAKDWLNLLREHAVEVNRVWAEKLGINQSVSITTVKPSGTVSQLVDSASGIHPRYSEYYYRTVRADKKDPLAQLMRAQGFPVEDCVMKPDSTDVFYFPVKGPTQGVFRNDMTAIEQLEHYLMFKECWCEHNPSITVYVRDHEWLEVGAWVYKNYDYVGGVSFLPHSDHVYRQSPYQEVNEEDYLKLLAQMPETNWDQLMYFETDDSTVNTKELACSAGQCELAL